MAPKVLTSFIDGTWLPPGRRLVVRHNPGRLDRIAARWSPARPRDARAAMEAAAGAMPVWSGIPPGIRLTLLESFLLKIEQQSLSLSAMMTRENGKTLPEARAEIGAALADGRHLLRQVRLRLQPARISFPCPTCATFCATPGCARGRISCRWIRGSLTGWRNTLA